MGKFYAIKKGYKTGIYISWSECQKQVQGYKNPVFKKFKTKKEAEDFLKSNITNFNHVKKLSNANDIDLTKYDYVIYTDGGCRNHGNKKNQHVKKDDKSAWAYRIDVYQNGKFVGINWTNTESYFGKTNNQMELMGAIKGLSKLINVNENNKNVLLVCDSRYVLNPFVQGWLIKWADNNFMQNGLPRPNALLWVKLARIANRFSNLHFAWAKGHDKNKGNIYVDKLLNYAMDNMDKTSKDPKKIAKK